MDAPRESPILVFLGLFLLLSFIVLQYQKNEYKALKKAILDEPKIKRALEAQKANEPTPALCISVTFYICLSIHVSVC